MLKWGVCAVLKQRKICNVIFDLIFFFRFPFSFWYFFIFALARTKRVHCSSSHSEPNSCHCKGSNPCFALNPPTYPPVSVFYRAGGSSIIVCREIWPSQIGNCRQHCAAVLENALEKAVRGPSPASTSKFDFLYSTLSRRQTKEVTRVVGVCGIKNGIKKSEREREREWVYK